MASYNAQVRSLDRNPILTTTDRGPSLGAGPTASYIAPVVIPYAPDAVSRAALPRRVARGWSEQDDGTLLRARLEGRRWIQIHHEFFPYRSANACRKRHERLLRLREWTATKEEHLAREYMLRREKMWSPLAQRLGEEWSVIEQKCMSSGVGNLHALAFAHLREQDSSLSSNRPGVHFVPPHREAAPCSSPRYLGEGSARVPFHASAASTGQDCAAATSLLQMQVCPEAGCGDGVYKCGIDSPGSPHDFDVPCETGLANEHVKFETADWFWNGEPSH